MSSLENMSSLAKKNLKLNDHHDHVLLYIAAASLKLSPS